MREALLDGVWWLPSDPDNKIAGTVTFTGAARPTLRLIGAFANADMRVLPGQEYALIQGLCEKDAVTLIDCHTRSAPRHFGSTEQQRQDIEAQLMLVSPVLLNQDKAYFQAQCLCSYAQGQSRIADRIDQLSLVSRESARARSSSVGWV